jgi:Uma2 family endonuclease
MAGTEWHFQVQPPGEISRTLVPDVAFLSYERMPCQELEATEIPRIAPDLVVEIRSPDDRQVDIDEKVRVYLAAGTSIVVLVDPDARSAKVIDRSGERLVREDELVEHEALAGFSMPLHMLFELP